MEDEEGVELGILDLSDSILAEFRDFFSTVDGVAAAMIVLLAPSDSMEFSSSHTKVESVR